jgi:hypothetical protein
MTIQILDIYQGNKYDPQQEASMGTDAVLIKGGQGEYLDLEAHKSTYIADTEAAGLPWGIFWQMDARYSPEKHKAAIKGFHDRHGFGALGLWLACEKPFYPCPDWLYTAMPYGFYKPIESVWRGLTSYTGAIPGIYTSPAMWKLIFGQCPLSLQVEFAAKAYLWAAQYKVTKPDRIGQWLGYWFWQYQAEPDYSVFSGSEGLFNAMYGGSKTPPPPDPTIPPATPPDTLPWSIQEQDGSTITLKKG